MTSLQNIQRILRESRRYPNDDQSSSYNFVSAHPAFKGSYLIYHSGLSSFFEHYCNHVQEQSSPNDSVSLSERWFDYSPIFIDIDIKKSETNQRLTNDQKMTIVRTYIEIVKYFVDLDPVLYEEAIQFYLMEKQDDSSQEKAGFHGQFPFIWLHQDSIKQIHLYVIQSLQKQQALDNIGLPYDKIIDVIYKKCWCLYGSPSNAGKKPYLLHTIYNFRGEPISLRQSIQDKMTQMSFGDDAIPDSPFWNKKPLEWYLPLVLSAHLMFKTQGVNSHCFHTCKLLSKIECQLDLQRVLKQEQNLARFEFFLNDERNIDESKLLPLYTLRAIVNLLTHRSVDTYANWFAVGSAIFTETNGRRDGYDLFLDVSSRASGSNFDKEACRKKWEEFSFGHLDRDYLIARAYKDNFKEALSLKLYQHKKDHKERTSALETLTSKQAQTHVAPLQPDLIIHKPKLDLDFYANLFDKHQVVCLQSGMSTGKTHILKTITSKNHPVLSQKFKNILFIGNRISLNEVYYAEFQADDFELYLHCKERFINSKRLIIQIDSLHRIIGNYDLVVCDEIETTLTHLIDFVGENKKTCWEYLTGLLQYAPHVLLCDALLTQDTVEILFPKRKPFVVQNTYCPCENLQVKMLTSKTELEQLVLDQIKQGKKVVVPSNSCNFANELSELVKESSPDTRIALITGDIPNSQRSSVSTWNQYDLVIYTSTINAGISFDEDYFDSRICYFVNNSAPAKSCVQMLFRVRKTTDPTIYVFYHSNFDSDIHPVDQNELEQILLHRHRLDEQTYHRYHVLAQDLKMNFLTKELEKDDYYQAKLYITLELNRSHRFFLSVFGKCLRMHGMTLVGFDQLIHRVKNKEKVSLTPDQLEIQEKALEIRNRLSDEDIQNIVNAPLLSDSQCEVVLELKEKSIDHQYALEKFYFAKTYGLTNDKINEGIVDDLRDRKKAFRRSADLCELDDLDEIIRYYVKEHQRKRYELYQSIYQINLHKEDWKTFHDSVNDPQGQKIKDYLLGSIRKRKTNCKNKTIDLIEFDIDILRCIYAIELLQACGVESFHQTESFIPDFQNVYSFLVQHQADQKALFASSVIWSETMKKAEEKTTKANEKIRADNEVIRAENANKRKTYQKKETQEYTVWSEGTIRNSIIKTIRSTLDTVYGLSFRVYTTKRTQNEEFVINLDKFINWEIEVKRVDNLKERHTRLLEIKPDQKTRPLSGA